MLVSFSISNFRSFAEETTFSLVASNRFSDKHANHTVPIPGTDERVLRLGVLYGANGAGKSNFIKALRFLWELALHPRARGVPLKRERFLFTGDPAAPTGFDLRFIAGEKLFRYGLLLDDERVVEERLSYRDDGKRTAKETVVFDRVLSPGGDVLVTAPGFTKDQANALALAKIGGPQNQSFLATFLATLEPDDLGPLVGSVAEWFRVGIGFVHPDSTYMLLAEALRQDPVFSEFAGSFLKEASTGVDRLSVISEKLSADQLRGYMLNDDIATFKKRGETMGVAVYALGEGRFVSTNPDPLKEFVLHTIKALHSSETGEGIEIALSDESDGTQRLLDLLPVQHGLGLLGGVFLIDEIDRSLHPLLAWKYLDFFLKNTLQRAGQLILTTHDCHLLDMDLLRRDEIWFAEKDPKGATHLYSLADFKVRDDLRIDKHYLQGRFGAIPFLSGIDGLLSETGR